MATHLTTFWVVSEVHVPPLAVLAVEVVALGLLAWVVARRPADPGLWAPALNVFGAILVGLPLVQAAATWARTPPRPPSAPPPPLADLSTASRRPDIYYIILDGFARGDILREQFGYDLEPFLRRLEARGFFVARRMWKESQAAFGAAAKLGGGYESRVLEFSEVLDRLVSGQGGFRGSARRIGRDSVHLSWDFHEAKQEGRVRPGSLVCFTALGAGLHWGAGLVRI